MFRFQPVCRRVLWVLMVSAASAVAANNPTPPAPPPALPAAATPSPHFYVSGWRQRVAKLDAVVKKSNPDLVFLGDSITYHWNERGPAVWKQYYGSRNALNLGIGGDLTQNILWRVENGNFNGLHPKVLVLMAGTNNLHSSDTAADIAAGVGAIIHAVLARSPDTKILLLAIFPRGKLKPDQQVKLAEVNRLIARDDDQKHVFYMDIGKVFLVDGKVTRDIMPDQLHPNAKGYALWAAAIEPELKKLLGEK